MVNALRPHVMVGEGKSVGRDEGSRAAIVKSHRAQSHMVQPLLARLESVFRFHLVFWKSVEKPHAFIGAANRTEGNKA